MHPRFRLDAIAAATGGQVHPPGASVAVAGVAIDSRRVQPGDLFVALRGERADGHAFVADAFRQGAAACLVERLEAVPEGAPAVLVDSTLLALGRLARWHLEGLKARGLRVVAVTGSVGKTSTRRLCSLVLASRFRTLEAAENLNTEIGVPLMCLKATPDHQVLVLEFAMRGLGQIRYLAQLAPPDVGIVTRIGPSHLELLGSIEAIASAKGELVEALKPEGIAILNADDGWQRGFPSRTAARILWYGRGANAAVVAEDEQDGGLAGVRFRLRLGSGLPRLAGPPSAGEAAEVHLSLVGRHHVENALAAAACGAAFGLPASEIAAALASAKPAHGRLEVLPLGPIVVLDDTYNASPPSAKAALRALEGLAPKEQRVAVLADMLELGASAEQGHREVGQEAAQVGLRLLVTVGPQAAWIREGALAAGLDPSSAIHCPDRDDVQDVLAKRLRPGDVVLVKGSRGMQMEAVVAFLAGWARGA